MKFIMTVAALALLMFLNDGKSELKQNADKRRESRKLSRVKNLPPARRDLSHT